MRTFKKTLLIILGVIAVLAMIATIVFYQLSPNYNGEKTLSKLTEEVKVYYDAYGIPHIYGENEADAFRALGYVHAQDRLWQMELLRRIGRGGLSEVFGADLLETDKFFLSLGINEASENTVKNIVPTEPMVLLSQAYLDGINQFIEQGPTPVEFYLTGIEKRPFTLKDVFNTVGYMAFSFAMAHKTDPLLTNIKNKLGPDYLVDLEIDVDSSTVWIKNHKQSFQVGGVHEVITKKLSGILKNLPLAQFEGSNSWVIAPEKTKNGKVIFANDPHIGFAQPSVWYEAHLSTPDYEKYGYHLAGVPFPLLGHNRKLAYGLTMFENDDIDFYYEEDSPLDRNSYKTTGGYVPYKLVHNTIRVKDEEAVAFTYKESVHGPIVHGITTELSDDKSIAMSWAYTKVENKVMDALYGLSHANNLSDFEKALPDIHAPGLNIMYGDAIGNVAWFATAKLYAMPDSTNTKFILDGSSGKDEPLGYLDFSENPMAINPPWN
ncbi:Penicillin amidase [Arenibacter nanhaiticus]|uniref:Penicillin amidase n=1 Tax=Arenibacter nanhaiticus TaxID=558155 RepID=A0A1M6FNP3_9FLAO|nr:Penicillin amidase [Arenibacter nanhaiticus]